MSQPPKAKIYTKTGDKGTTSLVDGSCVEKFTPRVEAYGTVDELNSYLGVTRLHLAASSSLLAIDPLMEQIQNELFNIGSLLACEKEDTLKMLPQIEERHIEKLEKAIDLYNSQIPELRNFILPAGCPASAHLHVARTFCRRAERRAAEVAMNRESYALSLIYLNRLSDLLFTLARWANKITETNEVLWKKS